jgi:hypothetical protein
LIITIGHAGERCRSRQLRVVGVHFRMMLTPTDETSYKLHVLYYYQFHGCILRGNLSPCSLGIEPPVLLYPSLGKISPYFFS